MTTIWEKLTLPKKKCDKIRCSIITHSSYNFDTNSGIHPLPVYATFTKCWLNLNTTKLLSPKGSSMWSVQWLTIYWTDVLWTTLHGLSIGVWCQYIQVRLVCISKNYVHFVVFDSHTYIHFLLCWKCVWRGQDEGSWYYS